MNTFFTSDHHFFHRNILKYCKRPFNSIQEMNEQFIQNHNKVVQPSDNVYFVGDFSLTKDIEKLQYIFNRLNGSKFIVWGNHDHRPALKKLSWVWTDTLKEIKVDGQAITLCHYAMRIWNKSHHGAWMLYGHSHGTLPELKSSKSTDVGVDRHNYTPIEFEQLKLIMDRRIWKPVDGHRASYND